jgi:hypothetical protein
VTVDDRHHGLIFVLGSVILGEVEARALKQSMSLQISRAAVDRLLDASNPSVSVNRSKQHKR